MKFDEFTDRLFESAQRWLRGMRVYEAGESFRVMVFEGKVDDYKVNTSFGLSFRGMKNGRMGYAYTEVLDEDAVSMLLRSAPITRQSSRARIRSSYSPEQERKIISRWRRITPRWHS